MNHARTVCFALPLLLLLAGCASTPAKRIEQNQKVFDALPVADQARIRGGQIDLGYTPDMTRIALGEPQRKLVRRTAEGSAEIWTYTENVTRYERQHVDIDGLSIAGAGGIRSTSGGAWITVLQDREYVRQRVEFRNGVVAVIEESAPDEAKK
jgi:hypothetical protein